MPNNIGGQPVYLAPGDPEQMNEPRLHAPGQLGMRVTIKQPSGPGTVGAEDYRFKTYQVVKTDSTMTVAPFRGAVAWWSDKTQYMTTTSPTALGRGRIAGVYQNGVTPGNFTCVQVKGPATVKIVDAPTSPVVANTGQFIIPSATAGKADALAAGNAATYPPLGVTAGTLNLGDNTVVVDLDVPETV